MRRPAAFVIAALAFCLTAVGAEGATRSLGSVDGHLDEGPRLFDGGIAWRESVCLACFLDDPGCQYENPFRVRWQRGAQRRTLDTGSRWCVSHGGPSFDFRSETFDLTSRWIAIGSYTSSGTADGESSASSLVAGPVEGPLSRVVDCDDSFGYGLATEYALDGDVLAYDEACSEGFRVAVRNLSTGDQHALAISDTSKGEIALSGRYLAVAHEGVLRVYDHQARQDLYQAALPPRTSRGSRRVDVSASGDTAVFTRDQETSDCPRGRLSFHRPDRPVGQVHEVNLCGGQIRLVPQGALHLSGARRPAGLRLVPFEQAPRTIIDFRGLDAHTAFDADSQQVVFAVRGCSGRLVLHLATVDGGSVPGSAGCPIAVSSQRLRATRRSRFALRLRCPRGCAGRLAVRRGRRLLAGRPFSLEPSRTSQWVRVRLRRRGRALLRRQGFAAVRIEVTAVDRAGRARRFRRAGTLARTAGRLQVSPHGPDVFEVEPKISAAGKAALAICFEDGTWITEARGIYQQVVAEKSFPCPKGPLRRALPVSAQGRIEVRLPAQAREAEIGTITGLIRPLHRCQRVSRREWSCPVPAGPVGRKRLQLDVRYPDAGSSWTFLVQVQD